MDFFVFIDVISESDVGLMLFGGEWCCVDRGRSWVLGVDGFCGFYVYVLMIYVRGESGEEEYKVGGFSWSFIG